MSSIQYIILMLCYGVLVHNTFSHFLYGCSLHRGKQWQAQVVTLSQRYIKNTLLMDGKMSISWKVI